MSEGSCKGCYWMVDCPFCGKRCDDYTGNDYGAAAGYRAELHVRAAAYRARERDYADGARETEWRAGAGVAERLAARYGR